MHRLYRRPPRTARSFATLAICAAIAGRTGAAGRPRGHLAARSPREIAVRRATLVASVAPGNLLASLCGLSDTGLDGAARRITVVLVAVPSCLEEGASDHLGGEFPCRGHF